MSSKVFLVHGVKTLAFLTLFFTAIFSILFYSWKLLLYFLLRVKPQYLNGEFLTAFFNIQNFEIIILILDYCKNTAFIWDICPQYTDL